MQKLFSLVLWLLLATSASAEVRRVEVPGGWYADNRPGDQAYVALVRDSHFVTHQGIVMLPDNTNILFVRIPPTGPFTFAGQDHLGRGNLEWFAGAWRLVGDSYGVSPVIYDWNGRLHQGAPQFGSQGFRYVDPANTVITGDATYADPSRRIWEYTTYGDITIGQGEHGCIALRGTERRMLEPGHCTFVRYLRIGDAISVAMVKLLEQKAVLLWMQASDLASFPPETTEPPNPPDPPEPPEPPKPPQTPCPAWDGITEGAVISPEIYVQFLLCREDASDYRIVLRKLEEKFYKYGFGLQAGSDGIPRGRLFLPHAACPNAAPRNEGERLLMVRQDEQCWDQLGHAVDIVDGSQWTWADRGGKPYQPFKPGTTEPPPPSGDVAALKKRIAELETAIHELRDELSRTEAALEAVKEERDDLNAEVEAARRDLERVTRELEELKAKPAPRCEMSGPGWIRSAFGIRCTVVQ